MILLLVLLSELVALVTLCWLPIRFKLLFFSGVAVGGGTDPSDPGGLLCWGWCWTSLKGKEKYTLTPTCPKCGFREGMENRYWRKGEEENMYTDHTYTNDQEYWLIAAKNWLLLALTSKPVSVCGLVEWWRTQTHQTVSSSPASANTFVFLGKILSLNWFVDLSTSRCQSREILEPKC